MTSDALHPGPFRIEVPSILPRALDTEGHIVPFAHIVALANSALGHVASHPEPVEDRHEVCDSGDGHCPEATFWDHSPGCLFGIFDYPGDEPPPNCGCNWDKPETVRVKEEEDIRQTLTGREAYWVGREERMEDKINTLEEELVALYQTIKDKHP